MSDHQANKRFDDVACRVFIAIHFGGTNTPINLQADFSTLVKMVSRHCCSGLIVDS